MKKFLTALLMLACSALVAQEAFRTDILEHGQLEKQIQLNKLAYGVYLVEITSSQAQFTQLIFRFSK